jgi:NADPH:quinone reductase-like Zn-dependent oxidoreductase
MLPANGSMIRMNSPRTLPVPEVGLDEVLIRVESAGVAVWDAFKREGGFAEGSGIEPKFPYVLGSDGAGMVAAVNPIARRRNNTGTLNGVLYTSISEA